MKYILLGASGTAKVIASSLLRNGTWAEDIIVLDDDETKIGNFLLNGMVPIVDKIGNLKNNTGNIINCVGSIGDNSLRNKIFTIVGSYTIESYYDIKPSIKFSGYIDPTCVIFYSKISDSVILLPNVTINVGTQIGNNVLINTGSIIEHDCKIGDYTFIAPGCNIAGNVTIGKNVFIGIGTTIIGGVTIGDNVVIGAGSLVLRDVESNSKVYGHPVHK